MDRMLGSMKQQVGRKKLARNSRDPIRLHYIGWLTYMCGLRTGGPYVHPDSQVPTCLLHNIKRRVLASEKMYPTLI